jgi:hypothetical protein
MNELVISRKMRLAVCAEIAKAARTAKPVTDGRARLMPFAVLIRRMRRAFP